MVATATKSLVRHAADKNGKPPRRRVRPPRINNWSTIVVPQVATSGVRVSAETILTFPAAYRAICIIAGAIASMPLRVFRRGRKFGREVSVAAPEHPVDKLLRLRPNPEQSPMRWKEYNAGVMAIRGNSFNEIVAGDNNDPARGTPTAIFALPANRMDVRRNEENREQIEYVYQPDDGPAYVFRSDRVLHFSLFGDDILGKSPVQLFRESVGLALSTEKHAASAIGKGMNPSGVLTHPGEFADGEFAQLEEQMNRRHSGADNAGRVLILENGMTWSSTAFNLRDSQFMEQRQFPIEEASRIWGVPPHLLSQASGTKYNNVEQLDLDFVKHTLLAYMMRIEEEIDFKLLGGTGEYFVKFNAKALLRGDIKTRYEAHAIGRQWGWLSANDVREIEDMDPLEPEVGDIYLSPVNMVPAEKAGEIGQPQPGESKLPDDNAVPAKPSVETAARSALRIVFRDAVGRLLHKEMTSLERILKREPTVNGVEPATATALKDEELDRFYDRLIDDVRHTLGPAWCAIGESDNRKADVEAACAGYVKNARAVILGAFRHGGRAEVERVLAAWRQCRADMVVTEFMEACYADSNPE